MQILGQWGANKRSSKGGKDGEEAEKEEPVGSRNSLTGLLMSRSENAAASKAPASPMPDIDSADRGDPLAATDYVEDIFAYYRRVESAFRTAPDYMKDQVKSDPPFLCVATSRRGSCAVCQGNIANCGTSFGNVPLQSAKHLPHTIPYVLPEGEGLRTDLDSSIPSMLGMCPKNSAQTTQGCYQ